MKTRITILLIAFCGCHPADQSSDHRPEDDSDSYEHHLFVAGVECAKTAYLIHSLRELKDGRMPTPVSYSLGQWSADAETLWKNSRTNGH